MAVSRKNRILGRWALMLHGLRTVPLMATMLVTVGWKAAIAQPDGQTASPVVASKVVETNQSTSQSFVGTLMPIRKSIVGSAVDGRVVSMMADEGEPVFMTDQKDVNDRMLGQPIVQLRTVSLEIEIAAAEVELRTREHFLEELVKTLPTEIESAEAVSAEIQARLKYSERDYERLQGLAQQGGGIPKREIEESYSNYSSLLQSSIAAEALLKKLIATREIRQAQAEARVEAQQQEIRRLQELKDEYTIRAPFAGFVTSTMTELGAWVSRGDPVMEIVQLDPIELVVNVPQSSIGQLQKSLSRSQQQREKYIAQIDVDSLPDLLEGEVVRIVPQADLRSRSFPVIIRVDNPRLSAGHLLQSGMLARAKLFIGRDEKILLVKKDALVLGGAQITVFVIDDDPQSGGQVVRPVSVQTGASIGQWIQITGQVSAGDLVVCEGNERLRPGQPVQVVEVSKDTLPDSPQSSTIN